jgi:hypothetical protein
LEDETLKASKWERPDTRIFYIHKGIVNAMQSQGTVKGPIVVETGPKLMEV